MLILFIILFNFCAMCILTCFVEQFPRRHSLVKVCKRKTTLNNYAYLCTEKRYCVR